MTRTAAVAPTPDAESAEPYVPQVGDVVLYFERNGTVLAGPMPAWVASVHANGEVDLAYLPLDSQVLCRAWGIPRSDVPKHGHYLLRPSR